MNPKTVTATEDDRLGETAAEWLLRLTPEFDPDDPIPDPHLRGEAFLGWLRESPEHMRVYLEIKSIEGLVRQTVETGAAPVERPVEHGIVMPTRRSHPAVWGIASGLVLALLGALIFWHPWAPTHSTAMGTYSTAIGKRLWITLRDGSRILLNTHSQVHVEYSADEWDVTLLEGEALFSVKHDPFRPFVVHVGDAIIQDLGTEFDVRRVDKDVRVAVLTGNIQVAGDPPPTVWLASDGNKPEPLVFTRLSAGEVARVAGRHVTKDPHSDVTRTMMWREGLLRFDVTPLAEAADEFNRYNRETIRVEGTVRQAGITGIFYANRPEAFVEMLGAIDSLRIEREGNGWVIRPR